jgi:hypothetical protein
LIGLDRIALLYQQFDDFNFLEVADIRDFDFHQAHSVSSVLTFPSQGEGRDGGWNSSGMPPETPATPGPPLEGEEY